MIKTHLHNCVNMILWVSASAPNLIVYDNKIKSQKNHMVKVSTKDGASSVRRPTKLRRCLHSLYWDSQDLSCLEQGYASWPQARAEGPGWLRTTESDHKSHQLRGSDHQTNRETQESNKHTRGIGGETCWQKWFELHAGKTCWHIWKRQRRKVNVHWENYWRKCEILVNN